MASEQCFKDVETYMTNRLNKLVGYTVVRPVFSHEVRAGSLDEFYPGLLLRNADGKQLMVWFLRDEEDNGAGYFDIQEVA